MEFQKRTLEEFYNSISHTKFDLITSVNFIDRIEDVENSFRIVFDLLCKNGSYIFASPLNFSNRNNWDFYSSVDSIKSIVKNIGFYIDVCFDSLVYKELLDKRGAIEEYPTVVMKLIKLQ